MNVLIRADASVQIGSGHIMRCLTLADELKKNLARVHFVCRDFLGHMGDQIREYGYQVTMLPPLEEPYAPEAGKFTHVDWLSVFCQQDATETARAIRGEQYDWVIVDHYGIGYRWHKRLRSFSKKIMVIDDLADRKFDCDLLLDQTYGRDKMAYLPYVPPDCQILTGSQYALLRPYFSKLRQEAMANRKFCKGVKRILVFMGGADLDNVTSQVLLSLAAVNFLEPPVIDVVLGRQCPHLAAIIAVAEKHPFEVNVCSNVSNIAEMMVAADLAIGAGGTASWERCCLGLPTIVIQTAKNQQKLIQVLAKDGVVEYLGDYFTLTPEKIKAGVESVLFSSDYYQQMVVKSFGILDGLGAKRVWCKIIEMSSAVFLRLAGEVDCEIIYKWQSFPEIRKYCRNPVVPSWSEHQEWFKQVLLDDTKELFMACLREKLVGIARLDMMSEQDDTFEVSILIAPEFQGKGYAKKTLAVLRRMKPSYNLMAEVFPGNFVSQKLFEDAGYKRVNATWFVSRPKF